MITGGWALLQNCHLATSWLPELVKIVEDIPKRKLEPQENEEPLNDDFWLWLTSMPIDDFPVQVL